MNNPENINEIYVLDENLELLCPINNFTKFEWTEKIYTPDSFSIEIPYEINTNTDTYEYSYYKNLYDSLILSIINGYYPRFITTNDRGLTNIGYIENFIINSEEKKLEIKGEGFLKFFERRLTTPKEYIPTDNTSDTVGEVMCRIINDNNKGSENSFVKYFEAIEEDNKVGTEIYVSCERKDNVFKRIEAIGKAYEVGYQTLFDYRENGDSKIVFQAYQYNKDDIDTALSKDDENILSLEYDVDTGKYYNYVFVEGENDNVIVDIRKNKEKEPILSIYKKSDKKQGSLSKEDYLKLLEAEGLEYLAEYKILEAFNIEPTSDIKAVLGKYYICKIDLGYGVFYKQLPLTSITHTIENNQYSRKVSFGDVYDLSNELKLKIGVS